MSGSAVVPKNWAEVSLEDVYTLHYGKALPKDARAEGGTYPVLGSSGVVGSHTQFLVEGPAVIVGRKGSAGSVIFCKQNFWPIDTTYFVRPPRGIEPAFAYYHFQSLHLNALEKSTAIPGLSRDDAYALKVAIPPTREQRRIVAKVEELFSELDKGIEALTTAREQLKAYRQSVLKYAFDVKAAPSTVEQLSEKIVDCLHSTPTFTASGKFCVDSTWIENNELLRNEARFVDDRTYRERIERLKPQRGDVLLVREGSKKIGTSMVVNFDDDFCLGQRMMVFRLKPNVLPQYFAYYIQSEGFKRQYRPLIGGSASPHLNISDIRRMTMPICSIQEQREIVSGLDAQVSALEQLELLINAEVDRSEALRQSILKQAFSGQLVAQCPNDEPASVLLERIRAERDAATMKTQHKTKRAKNGKKRNKAA